MFCWEALASTVQRAYGHWTACSTKTTMLCKHAFAIPALLLWRRCTWLAKLQTLSASVSGYAGWRSGGRKQNMTDNAFCCGYLLLDVWLTSQLPSRLTSLLQMYGTTPQWTPNGSISCLLLWRPHTTHLLIRSGSFGTLWGAKMLTKLSKEKKPLKTLPPHPKSPQQKYT